jgi:hypothetical protein
MHTTDTRVRWGLAAFPSHPLAWTAHPVGSEPITLLQLPFSRPGQPVWVDSRQRRGEQYQHSFSKCPSGLQVSAYRDAITFLYFLTVRGERHVIPKENKLYLCAAVKTDPSPLTPPLAVCYFPYSGIFYLRNSYLLSFFKYWMLNTIQCNQHTVDFSHI